MANNELRYTCNERDIMLLAEAVLRNIQYELNMAYWNKYQKEMVSPFDNTAEKYANDIFSVYAYSWLDGGSNKPNFQYKGFAVYWYKYMGRGMEIFCNEPITQEYITKMHSDCIYAIHKDKNI